MTRARSSTQLGAIIASAADDITLLYGSVGIQVVLLIAYKAREELFKRGVMRKGGAAVAAGHRPREHEALLGARR